MSQTWDQALAGHTCQVRVDEPAPGSFPTSTALQCLCPTVPTLCRESLLCILFVLRQ